MKNFYISTHHTKYISDPWVPFRGPLTYNMEELCMLLTVFMHRVWRSHQNKYRSLGVTLVCVVNLQGWDRRNIALCVNLMVVVTVNVNEVQIADFQPLLEVHPVLKSVQRWGPVRSGHDRFHEGCFVWLSGWFKCQMSNLTFSMCFLPVCIPHSGNVFCSYFLPSLQTSLFVLMHRQTLRQSLPSSPTPIVFSSPLPLTQPTLKPPNQQSPSVCIFTGYHTHNLTFGCRLSTYW